MVLASRAISCERQADGLEPMSVHQIQAGSTVSLHFALSLPDGEAIDSNFDGKPASFRLGDGSMLPGFEEQLLGLEPGNEREVLIPAQQAFGDVNPDNRQRFSMQKFKHLIEDELLPAGVGSVVSFTDPAGFELPGVVAEIADSYVIVDFNHPLAGKDIVFKVQIIAVLPPSVDSVELKL